jgi:hypothetical protein
LTAQQPQPNGGPFVAEHNPRFVPAAQPDFLKDGDRVVGLSQKRDRKSLRRSIYGLSSCHSGSAGSDAHHGHLVNALCYAPRVQGDVEGRTLTFERVGLRGSNFFVRDSETGSHWQQLTRECFGGPMKGKRLQTFPFLITTWDEWRTKHPQTLALVPEPAYRANYAIMADGIATLPYGSSESPKRELLRHDSGLPAYEQIMGVEIGGPHKAYPLTLRRRQAVLNDRVGSLPVLVVYTADSDTTTVFSRVLRGRTLRFHAAQHGSPDLVVDTETGSEWTVCGDCISGKLKGQRSTP